MDQSELECWWSAQGQRAAATVNCWTGREGQLPKPRNSRDEQHCRHQRGGKKDRTVLRGAVVRTIPQVGLAPARGRPQGPCVGSRVDCLRGACRGRRRNRASVADCGEGRRGDKCDRNSSRKSSTPNPRFHE